MKKILLSALLLTISLWSSAYDVEINGVCYDLNRNVQEAQVACLHYHLGEINWGGIYRFAPAVAVAIIGAFTVWLVFFGMNNATYPVLFLLLAEIGSDPLICTGMAPANVAVGGACLAYALLQKDADKKGVGISSGITALSGITEPGVYGVLFPNRYPLIGAMVGGGVGTAVGVGVASD